MLKVSCSSTQQTTRPATYKQTNVKCHTVSINRSAVITSVMTVLLCREMRGELFLSGARHESSVDIYHTVAVKMKIKNQQIYIL